MEAKALLLVLTYRRRSSHAGVAVIPQWVLLLENACLRVTLVDQVGDPRKHPLHGTAAERHAGSYPLRS